MCVDDDDRGEGGGIEQKISKHRVHVCVRAEIFPYAQISFYTLFSHSLNRLFVLREKHNSGQHNTCTSASLCTCGSRGWKVGWWVDEEKNLGMREANFFSLSISNFFLPKKYPFSKTCPNAL